MQFFFISLYSTFHTKSRLRILTVIKLVHSSHPSTLYLCNNPMRSSFKRSFYSTFHINSEKYIIRRWGSQLLQSQYPSLPVPTLDSLWNDIIGIFVVSLYSTFPTEPENIQFKIGDINPLKVSTQSCPPHPHSKMAPWVFYQYHFIHLFIQNQKDIVQGWGSLLFKSQHTALPMPTTP